MGLIIDNFAGGGGASTGLELALGRKVDIAINHDPDAIAMHKANHPFTMHYQESVWDIDPIKVCNGKEVDIAWFSPDCKHFSKAKGSKPVDKHIRGLAWIALRWAGTVRPKVIFLENVEEFKTWGPVRKGHPVKSKVGQTFNKFISQLRELGYDVDYRELVAADYGAPTKRKRFFMVARCDGKPIVWPKATHAPRDKAKALGLKPYRSASEIIDWDIPCPSIFERKKPLTEATMKRIARGIQKFVIDEKKPFIIPIGYGENKKQAPRVHDIKNPMPTLVGSGKHYLVSPYVVQIGQTGFAKDRSSSVEHPLKTVVTKNEFCLLTPTLMINNTGHPGGNIQDPTPTITTGGHHYLISPMLVDYHFINEAKSVEDPHNTITTVRGNYLCEAFLAKHFGGNYKGAGADIKKPLPTITSDHNALVEVKLTGHDHIDEVNAFLVKYYGGEGQFQSVKDPLHTITSKPRFGLVTINKLQYQIVDIGMRMLTPRELYNAQGFPPDYIIDKDYTGKKYPINKQITRCGNAVPPPFAEVLARANCSDSCVSKSISTMHELKNYKEQLSLL